MDLNLILFNGYGLFVWPAFLLTFLSCFLLYTKTKKELEAQQELYLSKFNVPVGELEIVKKDPISKEVLSGSSVL
jgi:hypothetical protein